VPKGENPTLIFGGDKNFRPIFPPFSSTYQKSYTPFASPHAIILPGRKHPLADHPAKRFLAGQQATAGRRANPLRLMKDRQTGLMKNFPEQSGKVIRDRA
jgi:hypothetical protein